MKPFFLAATLSLSILLAGGVARAEIPMAGSFTARQACPAPSSIHGGDNPGEVVLEANHAYKLVAKNKDDATYYLILVPGATPARRWVPIGCGQLAAGAIVSQSATNEPEFYLLAASWEPSFCATEPQKTECRAETPGGLDARQLSLHGLWPQSGEYCHIPADLVRIDRDKRFDELPAVELSTKVRADLDKVMPGTQSSLERHEWVKHGSCAQSATPESYFAAASALMAQLNASKVGALFANRVGAQITTDEIKQAMEDSFGKGAGDRIRVNCKGVRENRMIMELSIGLVGRLDGKADLATLIAAATPTTDAGCPSGVVTAVGR